MPGIVLSAFHIFPCLVHTKQYKVNLPLQNSYLYKMVKLNFMNNEIKFMKSILKVEQ